MNTPKQVKGMRKILRDMPPIRRRMIIMLLSILILMGLIVAFNIFHHFLKTEDLYNKLRNFLNSIKFKELFIQVHSINESQMKSAFLNLTPE